MRVTINVSDGRSWAKAESLLLSDSWPLTSGGEGATL